jgi:hypothetical protein
MSLTVVMVQKQYQKKFVPGTKKRYHGTAVHFGNDIRERLEGPIIIFFPFSFVSLRKVGEWKAGMLKGGECGRSRDVWWGSRRYGIVTDLIFTTVRHIAREYKGILCSLQIPFS